METGFILVVLALTAVVLEILQVLRRGPVNHQGHLLLLGGDLVLLLWTLFGGAGWHSWQAWAGIVGAVMLAFLPSLLDAVVRRAVGRDRPLVALRASMLRELLAPGRAATAQREYFADLALVRAGQVDQVLHALRNRLLDVDPADAGTLHERIITMMVYARRFQDAVSHYETHLARESPSRLPALAVHIVRSYGELGDLERAGEIVFRFEQGLVGRDEVMQVGWSLVQARLLLIAFAGHLDLVEGCLSTSLGKQLTPTLRDLLRETARARSEERAHRVAVGDGAETALPSKEAEAYARNTGERMLTDLQSAAEPATSAPRPAYATYALIAVNAVAWVAMQLAVKDSYDLVRGGVSFFQAVRAGEWWRLWTAMFLHVPHSPWHFPLNMVTLYMFGRYVEPLFGWARFLVLYLVAGLAGNLLSLAMHGHGGAVLSLGASGAVLGLVGALIVTLVLKRGSWPETWRRTLLVNLIVLSALQLAIGFAVTLIDNWAHIGGGLAGALGALVFLPAGGLVGGGRVAKGLVAALLVALVASLGWAGVSLARSRLDTTLARLALQQKRVGPVLVTAPGYALVVAEEEPDWPGQERLQDELGEIILWPRLADVDEAGIPAELDAAIARDRTKSAKLSEASGRVLHHEDAKAPAAAGWIGKAYVERSGGVADLQLYYGRAAGGAGKPAVIVELQVVPWTDKHRALREAEITAMLQSVVVVSGGK